MRAINEKLAEIVADGTYEKITSSLIGYSPAPEEPLRTMF